MIAGARDFRDVAAISTDEVGSEVTGCYCFSPRAGVCEGKRYDLPGGENRIQQSPKKRTTKMKACRFLQRAMVASLAAAALCITASPTQAKENVFEAVPLGVEAYIYGYPLVTMEYTRRGLTNVEKPDGSRAPMGQIVRMREYPAVDDHLVTAPNADTLYTTGFVDVSKEPYVLSLPDAKDRYYLFPMLDGWTDVFQVPGKRTTGTGPQKYAITGPGWNGSCPKGSRNTNLPPAWSGFWDASTARARRRTTRPSIRCRTRFRLCR